MTTKEQLQAAMHLIVDPKKWGQGLKGERPGTLCAGEALELITGPPYAKSDAAAALKAQMGDPFNNHEARIVVYNDEHTHAEVIKAFEHAIDAADES